MRSIASAQAGDPIDARVGRVLQGRYKVLAPIAAGAMGTVYRGERLTLGRPVAIKFVHAQVANDPLLARRFEVEARAMSCLAHPNCVSVIDFGVDESPYLVMDIVQGLSLRALIDAGPVPVRRALGITAQLLAALAHAHSHGIIHRDIKPDNILIESVAGIDDHVRVTDFGLARFVGSEAKLTAGLTLGTPDYMAPELTREGPFDHRVDLYAAGVVLFELLIGRTPFAAPEIGEVFLRVLTMPPPRLREVNPQAGFSAELEQALCRSMAKQRGDRFSSASALALALDAVPEARGRLRRPFEPAFDLATVVDPVPAFLPEEPGSLAVRPPGDDARVGAAAATLRRRVGRVVAAAAAALGRAATALRSGAAAWPGRLSPLRRWLASRRTPALVTAGFAVVVLVVLTGISLSLSGSRPAAADDAAFVGPPAITAGERGPVAGGHQPAVQEDRDREIDKLLELRRSEPGNAEHPAALAPLYARKRWWASALEAVRAAVQMDPRRKTDRSLIAIAISALQSDKAGDQAAELLRDLGPTARPQLREASERHPSLRVRARARELIRSSERKPFLRWFSGR